jgi:DNA repair exonuclease SbcCD nuclease subunit
LTSCEDVFDYSPYVVDFDSENTNVNNTNITELLKKNSSNIVRIAFTGDTHRFFDEFDDFVSSANSLCSTEPVDFVIHVGDIADFGLPKQYLWGNSFLLNLDCPYLVCIGNHDLVGNGGLAYSEMFGEYNFSFVYNDIKFIFINTNGRESGFNGKIPDINWLNSQLKPADDFTNAVVVFHVPPVDVDFDSKLEESFHSTIAKYNNVLFAVHGHLHDFNIYNPYSDSVTYVNVYGVEHRKFNVITISDDSFEVETYGF